MPGQSFSTTEDTPAKRNVRVVQYWGPLRLSVVTQDSGPSSVKVTSNLDLDANSIAMARFICRQASKQGRGSRFDNA